MSVDAKEMRETLFRSMRISVKTEEKNHLKAELQTLGTRVEEGCM